MMPIIQAVGLVALILGAVSVQFKHRSTILLVQILASVAWVLHFLLLGAYAGAIMNAVGVLRTVSYYVFRNERPSWLPWSLGGVAILATALTWQDATSLLPLVAILLIIYGLWQQSEQKIRIFFLLCIPFWFTYNLIFMSYAGMASDLLALVSGLIALYRHRKQGFEPARPSR